MSAVTTDQNLNSCAVRPPLPIPQSWRRGICGEKFVLLDKDGSAAPEKEYRLLLPPEIKGKNDKIYGRRPASWLAAELVPALAAGNHHFIVFGKSRRNVEVILKEARDKMEENGISRKISGYRGGIYPCWRGRALRRK